jgi:hypothetical protein
VVVALALSGGGSSPPVAPPANVPAAVSRFPAPPAGAFVLARQDDTDVLALAVLQQPSGVALQVSDVTQNGTGATGLRVSFAVSSKGGTVTRNAAVCGAGCYRANVRLATRPQRVQVRVARPSRTTRWAVTLPAAWPARDATAIVARAGSVWRKLRSLRYRERLASDSRHAVVSEWQIVAPDRLAYQIEDEGQAVIVGTRRWDRQKGGDWVQSSALRLHQPVPFWVQVANAHVLGDATMRGRDVWRVSFFDPRTPGWFVAAIDKRSYRTLDVRMTAAAHFMHDSYGSFNTSIKIGPPPAS